MRIVLIVGSLTLLLLMPIFVSARGLVPCGGEGEPFCQACHFLQLGQNLLTWFIKIMAAVIVLVFAFAGFKMVMSGGSTEAISKAKSMMTNSIIGLIIMLGAWVIVNTLLYYFVRTETVGSTWNEIKCVAPPRATTQQAGSGTAADNGNITVPPSNGGLSEAEVRSQLSGITVVSSGGCNDPSNRSCTGLAGLQQNALNEIKSTINSCSGCNLQITAGTEVGHRNSCHQSGTCVDVDCRGGCSVSQIRSLIDSARSNGARAVYEVSTQSRREELIRAGVPASNIQIVSWITGEHSSLYTE